MSRPTSAEARIWRTGSGPKMVLLHGEFGDAPTYWSPIVEAVAGHFDLILPDLPGFGESLPPSDYHLQTYLRWLKQLVDALIADQTEPDQAPTIVLGGAGFGATLARLFAARYQNRVRRLILSGGGAVERASPLRGLVSRLVGGPWANKLSGHPRSARDLFHDPDRHCSPDVLRSFEQTRPVVTRLRQARGEAPLPPALTPACPTLLLWGNEDRYCPLTVQQSIATELKDSRQVEIFEAGHLVMIEQPHRFRAHVLDFALPE